MAPYVCRRLFKVWCATVCHDDQLPELCCYLPGMASIVPPPVPSMGLHLESATNDVYGSDGLASLDLAFLFSLPMIKPIGMYQCSG